MVVEHRVVPVKLDELADPPQRRLGVEDQVLVADLGVVLELRRCVARLLDLPLPSLRHVGRGELADRPVEDRQGHVAPVADHVDEARLRQRPLDLLHLPDVVGRLLAPARLALARRVGLVEGAKRLARGELAAPLLESRPSISMSVKSKSPHSRADFMAPSTSAGVVLSVRLKVLITSGTKCVSGGIVSSGCESSIIRSSVVPERFIPTTNGAGARSAELSLLNRPIRKGQDGREGGAAGDDGGLVPQLGQEVTRKRLELLAVGVVHLGPPDVDPRLLGRLRRHRVRLHSLLARQRPARAALALPVHLLQPLGGALVVVEHDRVPVELDELADAAQRRLGVPHEVLVADLHVAPLHLLDPPRAEDPVAPALRHPLRGHGLRAAQLDQPAVGRERHVAAIADHVDEARLGDRAPELGQRRDVARGLVAPPRLAGALGVEAVEGADRIGRVERLDVAQPVEQLTLD